MNKQYSVNINAADNGIIVNIGCKTLVFEKQDIGQALADIKEYLEGGPKEFMRLNKKYFPEDETLNRPIGNVAQDCCVQEAPSGLY